MWEERKEGIEEEMYEKRGIDEEDEEEGEQGEKQD